jgi:hypothetical protein
MVGRVRPRFGRLDRHNTFVRCCLNSQRLYSNVYPLDPEQKRAIQRQIRADEIRERQRVTEEAKKEGYWTNLVPIRCPQCGDIAQRPAHWNRPVCALCHVRDDKSVRMQRVTAATQPESLDTEPLPELPLGLRPYEERVLRAMRRAVAAAARDERTTICRWLRRQAREQLELDARALADLVKGGKHLRSP